MNPKSQRVLKRKGKRARDIKREVGRGCCRGIVCLRQVVRGKLWTKQLSVCASLAKWHKQGKVFAQKQLQRSVTFIGIATHAYYFGDLHSYTRAYACACVLFKYLGNIRNFFKWQQKKKKIFSKLSVEFNLWFNINIVFLVNINPSVRLNFGTLRKWQ